jgi:hypothetical protein
MKKVGIQDLTPDWPRRRTVGSVSINPAATSVIAPNPKRTTLYEPVASNARPMTIGPAAPARPQAVQLIPYSIESERESK